MEIIDEMEVEDQCDDKVDEKEQLRDGQDPVKKFQFTYDESVCMTDKYPEITVAPGEGQRPKSILSDPHWDVKAFPHLHNADGSNGKDQEREVKLTAQRYFIQRICNKETRFAKCSEYLFSAVNSLELQQIYRNISLVGRRGKKVSKADGRVCFELEDEYRVLENMPNTPKYLSLIHI